MANETTNDLSSAFSNLLTTAGQIAQQQVDLLSTGIKAVVDVVEPLGKTAIDFVGSTANTVGQVLQNVSATILPKK
ncbi:MAG: chlorosome envelope protein B [Chlorobiaceae bacterium]